jgi:hypothetical protein
VFGAHEEGRRALAEDAIRFAGTLTEAEFRTMQRLGLLRWFRYLPWILVGIVLWSVGGSGGRLLAESWSVDPRMTIVGLLPLVFLIAFVAAWPRMAVRQAWRRNELVKMPVSGAADATGIEWDGQYIRGHYPWTVLKKYRRAAAMVVVYTQPNSVMFFPRSFFSSDTEWERFVALVAEKVTS